MSQQLKIRRSGEGAFINSITSRAIPQRLVEHSELDLRTPIDLTESLDMAQKQSVLYASCKVPDTISAIGNCNDDNNSAKVNSPTAAVVVQKKHIRMTNAYVYSVG